MVLFGMFARPLKPFILKPFDLFIFLGDYQLVLVGFFSRKKRENSKKK